MSKRKDNEMALPEDGLYLLPFDVDHQKPDRRVRYGRWWEKPKIKKGHFRVITETKSMVIEGVKHEYTRRLLGRVGEIVDGLHADRCEEPRVLGAFMAVLPHLEPVEESFNSVTAEWYPGAAKDVLKELVGNGNVTLEQLKKFYKIVYDRPQEGEEGYNAQEAVDTLCGKND